MLPTGVGRFMLVDSKLNEWRLSSLSFESGWTDLGHGRSFGLRPLSRFGAGKRTVWKPPIPDIATTFPAAFT
jgi:hypothetical protein